jgi:hypothetical protein
MVHAHTASDPAPLFRLAIFCIGLAIAGSILAGAHYFAIDLPQQQGQPPYNMDIQGHLQCIEDCIADGGTEGYCRLQKCSDHAVYPVLDL